MGTNSDFEVLDMTDFLKTIHAPSQLKNYGNRQLQELSEEIREKIVTTVAHNGGHLASNLGAIELTIALHMVFDMPTDKIVFDVGHQCYAHKLLTGRYKDFETIRKHGGLSGFPKRDESDFDVFGTGHASTSISAALGFALSRDLNNQKHNVVAVIGDGALTGGMALEALNHAGYEKRNIIIVLNDNEHSISKNIGALSVHLNKLRTSPYYIASKQRAKSGLKKTPIIGQLLLSMKKKIELLVKQAAIPTRIGGVFELLGFKYMGPIDGHNIAHLKEMLSGAKSLEGPVLIHVITKKGKGYKQAEEDATTFHSIASFNKKNGKVVKIKKAPTYTEVFGDTIAQIALQNKKIVGITAAMADGTDLSKLKQVCPERFFDVGIAEQHAVTLAAGLAASGMRPVVGIYSSFLQRAYDQINHDICLQNLPVIFAIDRAGLVGDDGPTHHGVFDLAYLRHIPNMTIMAPKDEAELRTMLLTAVKHSGPVAIRYPRAEGQGVDFASNSDLEIGKAEVIREGDNVAIIACGPIVYNAIEAASLLRSYSINATVVNLRSIKPIDEALIKKLLINHRYFVTVEEHVKSAGCGSAILELVNKIRSHQINVEIIALPDKFIEHGSTEQLRAKYGLTANQIAGKALNMVNKEHEPSHGVLLHDLVGLEKKATNFSNL